MIRTWLSMFAFDNATIFTDYTNVAFIHNIFLHPVQKYVDL